MSASEVAPAPVTERPSVRWARAVAFLLALVWIVGPPFYKQILHGRSKHARAWVMFSGIGLNAVDARFYTQRPDGTRQELDRWEGLGEKRPQSPRKRRLRGQKATWGIARQLCRRLGPDADIRVVARRATRDGWVVDYDGETNLCTAPPPRTPRKKNAKKRGSR